MSHWDYDSWWHASTGRYIVTEGHLPENDPFSFTSTIKGNKNLFPERENFILKQYWLAQILFYIIFDHTGSTGIILLRSVILLLSVLIVYWQLQRSGVSFPISFIFSFLLFLITSRSLGERPVLFSILFTAVVLFLLVDFKTRRGKMLFLIVPVMLIWSNMHGGFILGVIIILVFMFGEAVKAFFRRSSLEKREKLAFYSMACLALIASFINPNGWDAFFIALSSKYDVFLRNIHEYQSPFFFYKNKIRAFDYPYFTLVLFFPVILFLRNRKIDLIHLILLSGFFIMSLKASRYVIYYGIVGSMIMAIEVNAFMNEMFKKKISEGFHKKIEYGLAVAVLISSLLYAAGYFKIEHFRSRGVNPASTPVAAVDFIEKNRMQGNMFNDYGYGGYITWRLYPVKNFIDTRSLNRTVMNEWGWIVLAKEEVEGIQTRDDSIPLWETLLSNYRINFILMPLMDLYGNVIPLILELAESDDWVPVYIDYMNIIFIRNEVYNSDITSKYYASKEDVYNMLIAKNSNLAMNDKLNPRHLISLGSIFEKTGRYEEALKAYKYASARWDDPELIEKIKKIDAEFEKMDTLLEKGSNTE
jgi:hypothetical protein